MINLFYSDPKLAIKNAFLYINEVKENVFVYKYSYGDMFRKQEYSLRTARQVLDLDSKRIIFTLTVVFNAIHETEETAISAAEYYSKKFGFKIKIKSLYIKKGDKITKKYKLINPSVKEPEILN
jgi:hypothetical protein